MKSRPFTSYKVNKVCNLREYNVILYNFCHLHARSIASYVFVENRLISFLNLQSLKKLLGLGHKFPQWVYLIPAPVKAISVCMPEFNIFNDQHQFINILILKQVFFFLFFFFFMHLKETSSKAREKKMC